MARVSSAAQGSRARAAVEEAAARPPVPSTSLPLDSADAEELLVSLGFLLVPGPPLDRGPAYLLVALRPTPTLSHFDPERILMWANTTKGSSQMVLEWPLQPPDPQYAWGTIDIVDRLGEINRFASFGGAVSVARDRDVHAVLFRSDAPILSAGGHSGPADPLGADVAAFFGVLRAAAGSDRRLGDLVRSSSPIALYAAFLARSLAVRRAARAGNPPNSRYEALLHKELCRLEREAGAELLSGEQLAAVTTPLLDVAPRR